jgi:hypothetical protein
MNGVSEKQKKELAAPAAMRDAQIDFSDAPEVRDSSRAAVGKFYRPIQKSLTIRLDATCSRGSKARGAGTRLESTNGCAL